MLVGIISFCIRFFRNNTQQGFTQNIKSGKTKILQSMRFLHHQWEHGETPFIHAPV